MLQHCQQPDFSIFCLVVGVIASNGSSVRSNWNYYFDLLGNQVKGSILNALNACR